MAESPKEEKLFMQSLVKNFIEDLNLHKLRSVAELTVLEQNRKTNAIDAR